MAASGVVGSSPYKSTGSKLDPEHTDDS